MNIYGKLQKVRADIVRAGIKKSGKNTFSGYTYFELEDFIPDVMLKFEEVGLCPVVSYPSADEATLTIYDTNSDEKIEFRAPMGKAALKGCHDAQNVGAAESYARRYLYIAALELTESDAIENTRYEGETNGEPKPKLRNVIAEIADVCASITQIDAQKYRSQIADAIRKHNGKSANFREIKDVNIAVNVLDELRTLRSAIVSEQVSE